MFQKIITVAPWGVKLILWYGCKEELIKKCSKVNMDIPKESGIAATRYSANLNSGIIWISPNDPLMEERCLIHELIHFVDRMFYGIGFKEDESNNEGLSYQVDYLYGELILFIRKHHESYETTT